MSFRMKQENRFKIKDVLDPLNDDEIEVLCTLLLKMRDHSKNKGSDRIATACFLVDRVCNEHTEDLSAGVSIVANKLANEPFLGDRDMLKSTLEVIMKAVSIAENMERD